MAENYKKQNAPISETADSNQRSKDVKLKTKIESELQDYNYNSGKIVTLKDLLKDPENNLE